ncbi:hypothetical protein PhCBS80983_g05899 [Powellomyces hirtus]|uniref:Protein MON2 homolog n=1 Tax=Powellomyces hirtus TaxID=109895 RepID=A0A507DS00_9FUNG|nr:hypothetical protein PhCBS80983_g05899 [Powellomyces hirtus]
MNVLASFLQNELINLSSEAKRKNPEIKEAAERLLYILRALKERENVAVTDGVDPVASELAKTDEALKPFIMACETKNAKLIPIAVPCLQRLIMHQAIPEGSIMMVLKTLSDLINSSMELQLKVLQTVIPLLSNYRSIHGEVLAEALLLVFRLQETKSPVVNNTAAATVRQMVTFVFEKVSSENDKLVKSGAADASGPRSLSPSGKDAVLLFKDLCLLTSGEPSAFLSLQSLPKTFGLELLEAVIAHHPRLFREHVDLANLMKERVCPLIIKSFSERVDFPLACRLMRVVHAILKQHHDILVMECEIFLSMFCRHLEPDHAPLWHRVLVMEVYKSLCADSQLLRFIYRSYDQKEHTTKIFHEMITAVRRIIVSENPALLLHPPHVTPAEAAEADYEEQHSLTASGAQMKLQCLDQLDKAEPPHIPDTYIIFLAIQCMNSTVESEAQFAMPLLAEASTPTEQHDDIILAIEMANASWAGILAAISFLVTSSVDDDVFAMVIRAYQSITSVIGLLGLTSHRDAFLASLSKSCLPQQAFAGESAGTYDKSSSSGHGAALTALQARGAGIVLTDRNVLCLRALINVAQCLTPVLEDKAWYLILETLQVSDKFISAGKTGRKEQSSMSLLGDLKDPRSRAGSLAVAVPAAAHMENQFLTLLLFTKKLFEGTVSMQDRNLLEFLRALCRLARNSTSGTGAPPPGTTSTTKESPMKLADEKSFAVSKLHDVALLNVSRLIKNADLSIWDFVINELVDMAHAPNCAPSVRAQLCHTISDILLAAVQVADLSDPAIELKLLEPLRRLTLNDGNAMVACSPTGDFEDRDKIAKGVWFVEVQKSGLETINKILQTSGQHLSTGWPLILEVIRTIGLSRVRKQAAVDTKTVTEAGVDTPAQSSTADPGTGTSKAPGLVRVAFPCLQLICTDFLSLLNPTVLHQCIEALGSFGAQTDDLNISLTAVGLLWSISDFVLTRRQDLEEEKFENSPLKNGAESTSRDSLAPPREPSLSSRDNLMGANISIKRSASACIAKLKEPLSKQTMDALWMLLLGHLSQLCSDPRPEVRNSANQTLFRTLSMNGGKLTLEAWEQCIWSVLFPLLERVQMSSDGGNASRSGTSATSPSAEMLNSSVRNSPSKQWDETKVITLSGISKCLFDFLPVLVELGDGFDRAWALFLDYIKSWCLGGSPEVAMAGVKSLRSLVQYPKNVPGGHVAENVQKHLVKLMRVAWDVWAGIGTGIIAGSDEHALLADADNSADKPTMTVQTTPPTSILHGFFTQDTLTAYVSVFLDIYAVIKGTMGLFEIRQLLDTLSNLLLYHTNPPPGATASRIRADFINDVDNLTPLQAAVLDLLTSNKLEIDTIQGAPEITITTIAWFIKLPFARRVSTSPSSSSRASTAERPPPPAEKERGFTYMALAKKSMQHLVEIFDRYSGIKAIYSSRPFEVVIEALGVPMRAKYQCPAPGTKDTTPLWRSAANTFMTIVRIGLGALRGFVADLPQDVLSAIYMKVLDTLEGILLPSSEPPSTLSAEELSADEAFDISVLTTIESDIFPHLGQPHVPETVLTRLVEMIGSGSRRYTSRLEGLGFQSQENLGMLTISGGSSNYDTRDLSSNAVNSSTARLETIAKVRGTGMPNDTGGSYPLGSDVIPVTRENFAVNCLETIFGLCSSAKEDDIQTRFRIAEVVGPVMLNKCKHVIRTYTADKQSYGKMPLPRVRNEEIVLVMAHLQKLEMRPGVLVRHLGEDKMHPLRSHILAGTSAHLFALYPVLCDLIAVIPRSAGSASASAAAASGGEGADETAVVQAVRGCLSRVGRELGIE